MKITAIAGLLGSVAIIAGCATSPGAPNVLVAGAVPASAAVPARVDNFLLVDQNLVAHELYRLGDAPAVVIVTQQNGDGVIRGEASRVNQLARDYGAKGVAFMMLNASLKDSMEAIRAEATKAGYRVPILMDDRQIIGESLGITRSAEAIIINAKSWQVVYHGAIAGMPAALDALLAKQLVAPAALPSTGARIAFPGRAAPAQVTYVRDVAPILEARCVACHSEGGIGPFAMKDYATVKGFSPMIREAIRTKRMPPYDADPHVGHFADDRRLTAEETKTLVHWIEAGAPRGEGRDPLGAKPQVAAEWPLGKPDLILDIPAYKIPAAGVVDYQHPWVANPGTEGKWLKATTIKVESRQGVHHLLTGLVSDVPKPGQPAFEGGWGDSVGTYAVGAESEIAPKNVGTWVPPGGAIGFQGHYTPFGKEVTDHTRIALYYYKNDETPDLVMHNIDLTNNAIEIPPNEARHVEVAYMDFPHEALLYSAFIHAHYRGTASDLWIRYPNGAEKQLIAVPHYQFGWQRHYTFAEPIKVPAGSRLIAHYTYDNSKMNPANPDPNKTIVWGPQSWEEMFFTRLRYRWIDETSTRRVKYDEELQQGRLLGSLDANMDGRVQKAELKGLMGKMLAPRWSQLDTTADGVLDRDEIAAATKLMFQRRRTAAQGSSETAASAAGGR